MRACFSFVWFVYVVTFPQALHNIYFVRLWHDIAYVLKVPLNTKQTNIWADLDRDQHMGAP